VAEAPHPVELDLPVDWFELGQVIFERQCSSCHALDGGPGVAAQGESCAVELEGLLLPLLSVKSSVGGLPLIQHRDPVAARLQPLRACGCPGGPIPPVVCRPPQR